MYGEKLGKNGTMIADQKSNMRTIHMHTMFRPIKSPLNLQKPQTNIGQLAVGHKLNIAPICYAEPEQAGKEITIRMTVL